MKRANLFTITNTTELGVMFIPKDKKWSETFTVYVGPNSFKTMDFINQVYVFDLDKFYFQFVKDRKKINVNKIKEYGVSLEWDYYEKPKKSHNNDLPTVTSPPHAIKNDVHVNA